MNHRHIPASPRPYVHVDDPDLMDRLREVEGPDYEPGMSVVTDSVNVPAAQAYAKYVADVRKYETSQDEVKWLLSIDVQSTVTIFGWHGWTRYPVRGDGTVSFSTGHSRNFPKKEELARKAGFLIK